MVKSFKINKKNWNYKNRNLNNKCWSNNNNLYQTNRILKKN